jgi:DNA-binding XRE family transcriptional regulator
MTHPTVLALKLAAATFGGGKSNRGGGTGVRGGPKIKMGPGDIKHLRVSYRMTQEEFADKVGVAVQTVRSWEQGVRSPSVLSKIILGGLVYELKEERASG